MNRTTRPNRLSRHSKVAVAAALAFFFAATAQADVDGIHGSSFALTVKEGAINMADGGSWYMWGYAVQSEAEGHLNQAQYPGPTLIVDQNASPVTIELINELPSSAAENVSMVFPGLSVTATGGVPGALTQEAPADGISVVTYSFIPDQPGTYQYHSGTNPELQVEMGLIGTIIVRPTDPGFGDGHHAYNHADTQFDREYLFLLSELDPATHILVEQNVEAGLPAANGGLPESVYDPSYRLMVYWMINGRAAPDTLLDPFVGWMPNQPYNAAALMEPGERVLLRVVGAGRDQHPFHTHGNHAKVLAIDGRMLESVPGTSGPDIGPELFTIAAVPGQTVDAIWEWTGKGINWDIYGLDTSINHECKGVAVSLCIDPVPGPPRPCETGFFQDFDPLTGEWCGDHGKKIPVDLAQLKDITFGGWYSGSPFLGFEGDVPPGEGGLNPFAGFMFLWHSHTEKELANYDIFPGGMLTTMIVVPPGSLAP